MDVVCVDIAKERLALFRGERAGGGVHGQREIGRGAEQDLAACIVDLLVAAHLFGARWYPAEGTVSAPQPRERPRRMVEATHQRLRPLAQLAVDLTVELVGGE